MGLTYMARVAFGSFSLHVTRPCLSALSCASLLQQHYWIMGDVCIQDLEAARDTMATAIDARSTKAFALRVSVYLSTCVRVQWTPASIIAASN